MVANTSPPKDDVGQVKPGDASCARSGAPGVRAEGCRQLEDAYESRVEAILEALADGHSLREIAEHLRMSHTAVAKALTACRPRRGQRAVGHAASQRRQEADHA